MLKIPTVDDWWNLTFKYPQFRQPSHTALKDYGYMEAFAYLDERPDAVRILEFGHGFNATLFERYGASREVWGIDDWQGLHYFPEKDVWHDVFDSQVKAKVSPNCKFVRGLLGNDVDLPEGYFDVICSISVLEEVTLEIMEPILAHASRLLRPGGVLIGSHDICHMHHNDRAKTYIGMQRKVGLDLPQDIPPVAFDNFTLVENPTVAMINYQPEDPATRHYYGHWSTLWSVATKQ